MRITKEEKVLYKFLDIVNKIIGRAIGRTYIIGNGRKLFFYTSFYCGSFISQEDLQGLVDMYDFGACEYELKKLPNGTYVLDRYEPVGNTIDTMQERERVVENITRCTIQDEWCCEIDKAYENKIAKIASTTQKWVSDEDLYILRAFDSLDICTNHEGLVIKNETSSADILIAFSDVIVSPKNIEDSVQMKIEAYNNENDTTQTIKPVNENAPVGASKEEIGYDDDPMA